MENFAVAADAAAAVKRKRITHPKERIEKAVTLARHIGSSAAATQVNRDVPAGEQLTPATIDTWLFRFRKEGKFWEKGSMRGRPALMDAVPGMREEWQKQVSSIRAQGQPVSGRVSSTVAKAFLEEKAPSVLERHGGVAKVSVSTGARYLARSDMSYRKKTTSRIIPPDDKVADARDSFYRQLKDCFDDAVDQDLVLNFDQTFHSYSPSRGFTWEKRGADRVQVADSKEGFTLLPVVSINGVVAAQMIFPGSTATSLPSVQPGPLLHYLQTTSHWSNEETTLELFRKIIFPHIRKRRAELGDPNAPALVLADAFKAHWTPAVVALVASESAIAYVAIPDCLTHLFQPLDLGIIAAIKSSVLRRKDEFMETEVRQAIKEGRGVILSKSRPVLRDRVTMYIKECLADPVICAAHCCKSGFDRAGVTRVLYNEDSHPDVDRIVATSVCQECGEFAVARDDFPTCDCFDVDVPPLLCDGCFANHCSVCNA